MPLFEYTCRACGERFEALLPRAEADRAVCPKCGARRAKRELSTFAAAVGGKSEPACASGACGLASSGGFGGCSGGSCPFGAN